MTRAPVMAALLALAAGAGPARATVMDAAPGGFTVVESVHVAAAPDAVWRTLLAPERWWTSEHTYSQAANLKLDPKAGGCWCETLPGGGSVQHMTVIHLVPGKMLRLSGGLGPLQALPLTGVLTWTVTPAASGGADVKATYAVSGYVKDGLLALAPIVDRVLDSEAASLKAVAEKPGG